MQLGIGSNLGRKCAVLATVAVVFAGVGLAQDTRTVTEPVFPATCSVLKAQLSIVGGEPSSETAFDTTRLQSALTACSAGQAVELTTDGGSNDAFLIAPITLPSGVTLLVDGGVTVFASRNPADYQITGAEACGTTGPQGNGCKALITVSSGSQSGIMGYGVIDGRGGDQMLVGGVPSGTSWWDNARQAQVNGNSQDNFVMVSASKAASFTLYKITLRNSAMFHVKWSGGSSAPGFTAWGVKVATPYTARNTDGIDPSGTNITVTHSSISDGDDDVAISASSAASNITISNDNTYDGHGISVGSITKGGLSNMLVTDINQSGTAADHNGIGLRIKSAQSEGGLVNNVTYRNICMQNRYALIQLNPFYSSSAGTLIPQFQNIVFQNVHALTEGKLQFEGYNASNLLTMTLDNVAFDGMQQSDLTPAMQNVTVTLGPGPVTPALLQTQTGTNVTYNGSVTNPTEAPYACSASNFQFLVGEMYLSTASTTNQNALTTAASGTFTLNAILEPAMSQVTYSTYTGTPAPTAAINFMEGSTVVGTGTLGGNGTIASLTLTGVTAGTHTYTAVYLGDAAYASYSFGSVTVTVTSSTTAATTTSMTASPASVTYGGSTTLTATVSAASGAPTGTVTFMDGATVLGSAAVNGGVAVLSQVLAGGSHSIKALYGGDTNFAASTSNTTPVTVSLAASTTVVTAAPATIAAGGSAVLTATVSGVSGGAEPTGMVMFYDGTTSIGAGTLDGTGKAAYSATLSSTGAHAITATYAGDTNYASSQGSGATVTVSSAATTTTLTLSTPMIYTGGSATLTATVASAGATPTGSVTFMNGAASLGSATLVNGVATLSASTAVTGVQSITVVYAGNTNFAASTSAAATLTVVLPLALPTVNPTSLSLAAGASGSATVSIASLGGFSGTVSFSCATSVAYVTCSLAPSSSAVSGTTAATAMATIAVASTTSELRPAPRDGRGRSFYALLLPIGALTLAGVKRRRLSKTGVLLLTLLVGSFTAGLSGCEGNSTPVKQGTAPPAGPQAATITATVTTPAGTTTRTAQVTVNVTN